MDLWHWLILLSLAMLSASQPRAQTFNHTDLQAAVADMRSKSYYGFAILLQMLNGTVQLNRDVTFLMPDDQQLSEASISLDHLEDFLLSHSIPEPLLFSDLSHFPTGTLVPSGLQERSIRISNHGRLDYFVNNAQIVTPNVCVNSFIKCHGVDGVIEYNNNLDNEYLEEHSTGATSDSYDEYIEDHPTATTSPMHPPTASVSRSSFITEPAQEVLGPNFIR
ncbi:hypothetical protein L1049_010101 [Liquidambar formosana]|uniref:FAS1 domain-containing protein n=1 Tax=Liquidambar formosana TaxID=63359 RepID=A0AAP0N720_LIQFO